MSGQSYLAFDLGAESGRAMLGTLKGGKLTLEEMHRFPNTTVNLPTGLHWNLTGLWLNLVQGLRQADEQCAAAKGRIASLGVDTWGVDYGLIGKSGSLLTLPYVYRDPRTEPFMKEAFEKVGREAIYQQTGIQFMQLNSLYQLMATYKMEPEIVDAAERLLFIPDLLHYFFSGEMVNESSIVSTSQMFNPQSGHWAMELLKALDLPTHLLGPIKPSGTHIGSVRDSLSQELRLRNKVEVVAPTSHDTGSAVVAVPAEPGTSWCYLSCGTWSLLGAELIAPVMNDAAMAIPFTNEGGYGGTTRFLKNISGLWLVQECRRDLEKAGKSFDYVQLTQMANESEPMRTLINPDEGSLLIPGDMLAKLQEIARRTGEPVPETPGQAVRCCLESLALTYRYTLEQLEKVLNTRYDVLHIVGGGGQNELLCQMTADAIKRPVLVGPYEATAIGNVLVQAMTAGEVADLAEARKIVRESFAPKRYEPQQPQMWDAAYDRYTELLKANG